MTEDNPFLLIPYRVYIDTSVIGGCFDEKFSLWSNRLMTDIAHKRIIAVNREMGYSHPTLKLPMENLPKALLYGGSMTGNFPAGKEYHPIAIYSPREVVSYDIDTN